MVAITQRDVRELQLATGAIRAAAVFFGLGVAIDEGEILHRQPWMVLVVAMRRRPHLVLVAGVHVEDPNAPTAAQRHLPTTIDHDVGVLVVEDLGGAIERDDEWVRPAIKGDHPTARHRFDERIARAAPRRQWSSRAAGHRQNRSRVRDRALPTPCCACTFRQNVQMFAYRRGIVKPGSSPCKMGRTLPKGRGRQIFGVPVEPTVGRG